MMSFDEKQPSQGLYDKANEHDSCGVGFIANIKGSKSHEIILNGLKILVNLDHRGAVGDDPLMGDGAGCLIQIPDSLLRDWTKTNGYQLPEIGHYAVAMCFLPQGEPEKQAAMEHLERFVKAEGQTLLAWRPVPTDLSGIGKRVLETMPGIYQAIILRDPSISDQNTFERKLLTIRKQTLNSARSEQGLLSDLYIPSFSSRTIVYKGLLLARQVGTFYRDLSNPLTESALALVHQRFSTNTFPSWPLAHPYRMIAHNGEINTVRGNVNWMSARRHSLSSDYLGPDLDKMWPLIPHGQSDTACIDNALEVLVAGGYSLSHAMMMLIPEAWTGNPSMDPDQKAFYEYYAALMEPWDGPAAIAFTDGLQIGATLDRNGLRPARYVVTDDDNVIMASEVGVLPVDEEKIVKKWRLQPGKMLLIDFSEGRIIDDSEIKQKLAAEHPYQDWLNNTQFKLEDLNNIEEKTSNTAIRTNSKPNERLKSQQSFGYSQEDLQMFLEPMARFGEDPVGSMGVDTPIAVLSNKPKLLYNYFKQNFAQVTNPPIDPIREELVMSLVSMIGPRPNLLGHHAGTHYRLEVSQPILTNPDLAKVRSISALVGDAFRTLTIDMTWPVSEGESGLLTAVDRIQREAVDAVISGHNILVLSDRSVSSERIAIPALLATAAIHHHLIRKGLRTSTGLVVETGEAREVHHFCVLAGYGAEAINPWLAFDTLEEIRSRENLQKSHEEIQKNYIKAVNKGILKVMSKMGISTYQSYCGAQIFDAVGLSTDFIEDYFTGTPTTIEGAGINEIAIDAIERHNNAWGGNPIYDGMLDAGGDLAYRLRGEDHAWTPESVADLQHAVRGNLPEKYIEFANSVNDQSKRLLTIRGLMDFRFSDNPLPLEEVEDAGQIVKRFATGAMSFGSISREAHTTLAIAMNRIGGKSNTGEGGEEVDRFSTLPNGDSMRSAIKQVASGRFGVTTDYLVNADDIQIKMAQGAKPGEGGQLPGHKVNKNIASVRHSTPGVGLISPPPHHDIYSIEDLAQLIHDLKNVNPKARISVKLVSEVGVGTVAAGVSKARADHVTISGFEGGTGASPLTSLTHAGSPWEIGLSETQQTLVLNGLRGRIAVQVDGGLRTGRDVVVGALLGADEFGFSTAPLIASGCIMMRKCHLNTCPVGVPTQDPILRKRFTGTPEHVINYFFYVAEEVRELMSKLGFRTFDEMIGKAEKLDMRSSIDHWKAEGVDLSRLLYVPEKRPDVATFNCESQDHNLEAALDNELISEAKEAIEKGTVISLKKKIKNTNRTVGATLSGEVAKRYGHAGLAENTITITFNGNAGGSFGAFLARGITLDLIGDANDYVGKGLSGGKLIVRQPNDGNREAGENIIIGNTVLYGAIAGEAHFEGVAGERFAVRNSGAITVVEGVGDHGCEYMTGGVVVVLGETGRNFAAGMSGGIAYIYDPENNFATNCNMSMVDLETITPSNIEENKNLEAPQQLSISSENSGMGYMLSYDEERLRILVERHRLLTGSKKANYLLENWDSSLRKFIKVVPKDYRRALLELQADESSKVVAAQ